MIERQKYVYIGNPNKQTSKIPWFGAVGELIYNDGDMSLFRINKSQHYEVHYDDVIVLEKFIDMSSRLLNDKNIVITDGAKYNKRFVFKRLRADSYWNISDAYETIVICATNDKSEVEIATDCHDYTMYVVLDKYDKNVTTMTVQEYLFWELKK